MGWWVERDRIAGWGEQGQLQWRMDQGSKGWWLELEARGRSWLLEHVCGGRERGTENRQSRRKGGGVRTETKTSEIEPKGAKYVPEETELDVTDETLTVGRCR